MMTDDNELVTLWHTIQLLSISAADKAPSEAGAVLTSLHCGDMGQGFQAECGG